MIKNLSKAAQRIKKAIEKNENLVIFSDADLDGTTSLILIEECIENLGALPTAIYFPDREKEGYGLTMKALEYLKQYAPGVLLLLDCGISNFQEVERAKKDGFEVIIIEHHEILNKNLSKPSILVDPKQKGDNSNFKFFATCGICFKLTQLLLKNQFSPNIERSFLELVSLGTIADMMPQIDENKILIEKGLSFLPSTFRPGIKVFFDKFPQLSTSQIVQKIIATLQITETKNHLTESYLLLTESDYEKAKNLLEILLKKSEKRKEKIESLTCHLIENFSSDPSPIIFEGGKNFPLSLTGAVASRICRKFQKPTFIFNLTEGIVRGSVRTPKDINGVKALEYCHPLLEVYGGHPQACGFTLKAENIEKFKQCLIKYFLS